jgi:DNA-binding NtrC family response regulator
VHLELDRQFDHAVATVEADSFDIRREAANLLGMGRNTIPRKIQELGIDQGAEEEK